MIAKRILGITIFAILGLAAGYAFFGKWGGEYLSLKTIFSFGGNALQNAFRSISGLEDMRNKILLCGATGALVGLVFPFRSGK